MARLAAYEISDTPSADDMVREYLPLVQKIALRLKVKLPPDVELDDLLQVGLMGLLRARESYDQSQGASFATYASIRVKGAMLDEIRANDWLPRSVQGKLRQVGEAMERAEARLGRPAVDQEVADELSLPLGEYQKLAGELACARMTHIEEGSEDFSANDEEDNPFEQVGDANARQALAEAVERLPEKEQLMMSLYYAEGLNLKEIGAVLGVTESRVSQLHGQALARLRSSLTAWRQ